MKDIDKYVEFLDSVEKHGIERSIQINISRIKIIVDNMLLVSKYRTDLLEAARQLVEDIEKLEKLENNNNQLT